MENYKSTFELETVIGVSGAEWYWEKYIRKLFDWCLSTAGADTTCNRPESDDYQN